MLMSYFFIGLKLDVHINSFLDWYFGQIILRRVFGVLRESEGPLFKLLMHV